MKKHIVTALVIILPIVSLTACIPPDDPFSSSGCNAVGQSESNVITISDGSGRTYYLRLPENYNSKKPYPLVIAFHGTGGSHASYLEDTYYNLQGAVGNEAILVYPNALPNSRGVNQWNFDIDVDFFDDVIAELESSVCYDTRQVFAVGHSSGAGLTHTLGCQRGNVLRGIAPVAGSLISDACVKEVAVMQIQGKTDTMVPLSSVEPGRDFWVEYNSCTCDETNDTEYSECVEYPDCDVAYPVYWCLHENEDPSHTAPGHAWPPFAGEAIWDFFKTLPPVDPSLAAPTKSGECTTKETTMMQFSIRFPDDFGTAAGFMAITLYDELEMEQPLPFEQPDHILNFKVEFEEYGSGAVFSYEVEGNITGVPLPGEYTFSVVVYMEGGIYPVPTPELDYLGLTEIHIDTDGQIIIDDPIELEVLQPFE